MFKEIWKTIGGKREIYQISSLGNARTMERDGARGAKVAGHDLKPHKNSSGYLRYAMSLDNKRKEYLAHRLVAQAFIPNPNNYMYVNHVDGNKTNNAVNNLE